MFSTMDDQRSDEAEEALGHVSVALETLDRIVSQTTDLDTDSLPHELVQLQAQYCPNTVATESIRSTARTVIKSIVAAIARVVDAIIDFFRAEHHSARRCMEACERIIDASQRIESNSQPKRDFSNMAVMMAISYEGHCSRYMARELDSFYGKMIRMRKYSTHEQSKNLIAAVRSRNENEISARLNELHAQLEEGLKSLGREVSKGSSALYTSCEDGLGVYASERFFGDRVIFGQIGKVDSGSYHYGCMVRRDPSVRMRVKTFPVMRASDIELTARTVRLFCEEFIRNSDLENKLYAINREANYLSRQDDERVGIKELRTIVSSFQNVYIVSTRHAMYVTRNVVNYLVDCVRAY